ncbi:hypothetical protein INN71_11795 [Nocardioides sp. ChNu-153]|uniref:hypothetical protein n=1 Tax=unclassified Nocardioides TaxID=2615069 RepID=UPI002406FD36|nr:MULTISPECIES: hypothetical protein [unclassified Nocardioides]MDF9716510.1 hypothetical protein [Nocardioides sp. ChNu-99]MDN7122071.1 hypothetical protein [Nocardioides sp. ChNu-153]
MSTQQHHRPTDATPRELSRRTFTRAAAWSAPIVSVAVAAPAHAMSVAVEHDLFVAFVGSQWTSVPGGGDAAWASIPAVLEVSNLGTADSPVGTVGTLTSDAPVLQMQASHPEVTVTETSGGAEIGLPSVPAGSTLTVSLGALLDQEAALALGSGDHAAQVAFALTGTDASATNDAASAPVVITVTSAWGIP